MSSKVTIDTCDSEPIAFPSAIQSHGMLIVLDQELKIRQISENCLQFLGFAPIDVLDNCISKYLDDEQYEALKIYLAIENLKALVPLPVKFCLTDGACSIFHCIAKRYSNFVIVELEHIFDQPQELSLPSSLSLAIENLQSKRKSTTALQSAAECVKELTGYDRVLIYKFDSDWHGEVVAEAAGNLPESYLGLHFPASDIPPQARELYKRNLLRMIVEVNYAEVKITPLINPVTNELLDMSDCILRSVSPIHVEYLSNMGVKATLTISLIVNGQLWGLIACHHYSPKFLSGWLRTACDM
ncbi:MAG: GAF domain-containing protein, partial [Leptolyngbya sp.]|nr:GAF domain-containing protein [Candidatus Melainabacteria bacterium]